MSTLDPGHRDLLAIVIGKENADGGARAVATAGARAAIEALAVHLAAPYPHLDAAGKQLRNRLRARARQLGDARHADSRHEIGRLVEQTAYEHWHRMLFARFLAENELLIHPQMNVAVTLQECEELAPTEGAADAWELAGRYASRMLPQIFRPDDPVLAVALAAEHQRELERLLASLPPELFRASDSLGWCYQFWQARKKKEVNASEVKIGADELPAVTQLFTEPYMVQFLLHNTLGAWWVGAGRTLPMDMPYLRFLDDGTPAAGTFEGWPRLARELKVLDPCCGSGHFLVAAFEILVAFRMAEEGLSAQEACDAVLRDNLFGLEIDLRCVQIAAFALAMAAWTYPCAGGYRPLAAMHVACSGLAISARKEEWERLGGENARLRNGIGRVWELFIDAPVLGSLIDPTLDPPDPLFVAGHAEIGHLLQAAFEKWSETDADAHERTVAAAGINEASRLLAQRFSLVVTNVPYLTRRRQSPTLVDFCAETYPRGKHELAFVFLERALRLASARSVVAVVVPDNWTSLRSYQELRQHIISHTSIRILALLGEESWRSFGIRGPRVTLGILVNERPKGDAAFWGIDASSVGSLDAIDSRVAGGDLLEIHQAGQLENPGSRILFNPLSAGRRLEAYASCYAGILNGDSPRYQRHWWEIPGGSTDWVFQQTTSTENSSDFAGYLKAVWFDEERGHLRMPRAMRRELLHDSDQRGNAAWGRRGVAISQLRSLIASHYFGSKFDSNVAVLVPNDETHLPAIWCYCSSEEYRAEVRKLDQKKNVTNATLAQVPFDLERWSAIARERYPTGLPTPHSNDCREWIFEGHPSTSDAPLRVAVARLLDSRWPGQQPDSLDAHADADGIVCIPALRGERPAADRLADLLASAWGKDWHPQTLTDLLSGVGHRGDLEDWLRDAFFRQHCELFHHRPFIWHIWDGHREGFSALVNYHKLDHEGLKSLTYTYLGDWIRNQEIQAVAGESGAGDRLAKARALQQRLAAILEGEAPYDIFVRWKPIEQQPIGWRPDLDDGVRLNIRPFMTGSPMRTDGPKAGQGAGVLRYKPNIKWGKDRGKNPPGSPWGEIRDNDRHLTLAEKRAARGE